MILIEFKNPYKRYRNISIINIRKGYKMLYDLENKIMKKYGLENIDKDVWRMIFDSYIFIAIPIVKENLAPKMVNDFLRDLEKYKDKMARFYLVVSELQKITDTKNIADDLADFLIKLK